MKRNILRYRNGVYTEESDNVTVEEALEIFINGKQAFFCMMLPGMEKELAAGILYSEGIISDPEQIKALEKGKGSVSVTVDTEVPEGGVRVITSSSGALKSADMLPGTGNTEGSVSASDLFHVREDFLKRQELFDVTGGTHAAALYDRSFENISFAEDTGRHNALDKCVGSALLEGTLGRVYMVMLSSRMSFEMVRKGQRAGAAVLAGVSAPTSCAVTSADEANITLVGFLREGRFNVYSNAGRFRDI